MTAVRESDRLTDVLGAWRRRERRRGRFGFDALICGLLIAVFVLMAIFPTLFSSFDPIRAIPQDRLQPPNPAHIFGTDQTGRDLFSRIVHGASLSLRSGMLAVAIAFIGGSILGLLAGFAGGWVDTVISRICDSVLAIPGLLLSLSLLSSFGKSSMIAAIAIGVGAIPSFTRVMRSESLRVTTSPFVEAARASGAKPFDVIWRHVLPNSLNPVIGLAVLEFGQALLSIGALSYLGFGEAPPTPEWGSLIAAGQPLLATAWWLSILPGIVLAVVVLVVNRAAHLYQKRI